MRIRTASKNSLDKSPGPGHYNPKVDYAKENLGGVKIGTGNRSQHTTLGGKEVPGPGQYDLGSSMAGPAFGIGSSTREDGSASKSKMQTPGPGSYKVPTYIANLPKYSMPDRPDNLRFL